MNEERRGERLVALAAAGALALNYPLLHLLGGGFVLGLPLVYLYLLGVWALLIALTAAVTELRGRRAAKARSRPDASEGPDA